jgi:hypothetical protein
VCVFFVFVFLTDWTGVARARDVRFEFGRLFVFGDSAADAIVRIGRHAALCPTVRFPYFDYLLIACLLYVHFIDFHCTYLVWLLFCFCFLLLHWIRSGIQTIGRICRTLNFADYASRGNNNIFSSIIFLSFNNMPILFWLLYSCTSTGSYSGSRSERFVVTAGRHLACLQRIGNVNLHLELQQ